jgi:cell wall-associated NlpC family hydrolase
MLEKKYKFGEQDPGSGFDCSGLAQYAYKQAGINIPRTASAQYESSTRISKGELKDADLVFFSTSGPGATHVGIYLGNGKFIHSPSEGKKVQIVDLNNPYWKANFFGAGSYFK